jgi:hypothetical protein
MSAAHSWASALVPEHNRSPCDMHDLLHWTFGKSAGPHVLLPQAAAAHLTLWLWFGCPWSSYNTWESSLATLGAEQCEFGRSDGVYN